MATMHIESVQQLGRFLGEKVRMKVRAPGGSVVFVEVDAGLIAANLARRALANSSGVSRREGACAKVEIRALAGGAS